MNKFIYLSAAVLVLTSCLFSESPKVGDGTKTNESKKAREEFCTENTVRNVISLNKLDMSKLSQIKKEVLEKCEATFTTCSERMFKRFTADLEEGRVFSGSNLSADESKCVGDNVAWTNEIVRLARQSAGIKITKKGLCVEKTVKDIMKTFGYNLAKFDKIKGEALKKCGEVFDTCSEQNLGDLSLLYERRQNFYYDKSNQDENKCVEDGMRWAQKIKYLSNAMNKGEFCSEGIVDIVMTFHDVGSSRLSMVKREAGARCNTLFNSCSEETFGKLYLHYSNQENAQYDKNNPNETKCIEDSTKWDKEIKDLSASMSKKEFCIEKTLKNIVVAKNYSLSKFDAFKVTALSQCLAEFSTCGDIMFGKMARIYEYGGTLTSSNDQEKKCLEDLNKWVQSIEILSK